MFRKPVKLDDKRKNIEVKNEPYVKPGGKIKVPSHLS